MNLELRPTQLIVFGNARGGTPLMQSVQTIGIDLPLKALVWQDAVGKTWISYNAHPNLHKHAADFLPKGVTVEEAARLAVLSSL